MALSGHLRTCYRTGNMCAVPDETEFPQRLAALLDERGMTQLELAARVGVTRAAMSRYVSGDREPRLITIARIAEELNVHVDELLPSSGGDPLESAWRIVARTSMTADRKARVRKIFDEGGLE